LMAPSSSSSGHPLSKRRARIAINHLVFTERTSSLYVRLETGHAVCPSQNSRQNARQIVVVPSDKFVEQQAAGPGTLAALTMPAARFSSFREFFPYYLGEHRNPICRVLHFFGTAGFLGVFGWTVWSQRETFWPYLLAMFVLGVLGSLVERRRNAAPLLLGMVALGVYAQPWLLAGVVWAYAFAWVGHFKIEHNKPATFVYPLWSLYGDFRMWGLMATGRLWSGDPLIELGLTASEAEA
jgi:hypothetical protein